MWAKSKPEGPKKNLVLSDDPLRHSRLKGPKTQVKLVELYTGRGGRKKGAGGEGGRN